MKITSYGLFWRTSEIDWHPGQGNKDEFRLLGRIGANRGSLRVADFRHQQGIYILYDEYGPCYVGLTRKRGLGLRLKDHLSDDHEGLWDRFSWFGFKGFLQPNPKTGVMTLEALKDEVTEATFTTIGDLEALLIRAIGPKNNSSWMKFLEAEKWEQIGFDETNKYLKRLK